MRLLRGAKVAVVIVMACCLAPGSRSAASIWNNAAGDSSWGNPANWDPTTPNAPDAVADFSGLDIVADTTVHLNGDRTAGTLMFGDTSPSHNWILSAGTPAQSTLMLDVTAGSPIIDVVNQTAIVNAPIIGGDGLTKTGSGALVLNGANTYTGPTVLSGGTLAVNGSLVATGNVTVNTGATLSGNGDGTATGRVGNVTMLTGSSLRPGPTAQDDSIGTLTMSSLTVHGGDMRMDLQSPGTADRVDVSGAANFAAPSTVTPTGLIIGGALIQSAELLRAGDLTGTPPTLNVPPVTRPTFTLDFDTLRDRILLTIDGFPQHITWSGAASNVWDLNNAANWLSGIAAEKFFNLDIVRFDDGPANRNVDLQATVRPSLVIVSNSTGNDYAFSGTGGIGDSGFAGGTMLLKSGGGRLTLSGTNTYTGRTIVNEGSLRVTGSINNDSTVTVAAPATFTVEGTTSSVGAINGAGTTTVGNGAAPTTLTASNVRGVLLNIAAGSRLVMRPTGGPAGTSVLSQPTIAGATNAWTATLDLNNNDAIIQSTAGAKSADFSRLYNQLQQGFNAGSWTGLGITSTTAANNAIADTGLAVVDNTLLGYTTFSGQPVTADSILLKYTYYGDIDQNGQVDADDLTVFASNFGRTQGATQIDGDIDFNGAVNADDLTVFANNFNKGIGSPLAAATAQAVPEPGTWMLAPFALLAVLLFGHRRCRPSVTR